MTIINENEKKRKKYILNIIFLWVFFCKKKLVQILDDK